jgi:uncharacterized protein YqeY
MNTLSEIKSDLDHARREKNQSLLTLLVTLYSECSMVGKTKRNGDPTEDEVISVIKKFKLGVEEITKIKGMNEELSNELELYNRYLPKLLSVDELKEIISNITPKESLAQIMNYLKTNHTNLYDGRIASAIAKEFLET